MGVDVNQAISNQVIRDQGFAFSQKKQGAFAVERTRVHTEGETRVAVILAG
jgi:hypothetical protein